MLLINAYYSKHQLRITVLVSDYNEWRYSEVVLLTYVHQCRGERSDLHVHTKFFGKQRFDTVIMIAIDVGQMYMFNQMVKIVVNDS